MPTFVLPGPDRVFTAPAYHHPHKVWLVDVLPLASTNKIDRVLLKPRASRG